mmetsp:Transcript_292/g.425  ORF Transcript_292/g.425 Transcript_292/m.425 type:complete len:273 (+) Transcript_292:1448-2266(+)
MPMKRVFSLRVHQSLRPSSSWSLKSWCWSITKNIGLLGLALNTFSYYFFCRFVVMILNILFSGPTMSNFETSFGFSPSLDAASALTNSPSKTFLFFNVKNTSFTVDPGFINSTSLKAGLVSFLPCTAYITLLSSQVEGAVPPALVRQLINPLLGSDGSLVAKLFRPVSGSYVCMSATGNTRIGPLNDNAFCKHFQTNPSKFDATVDETDWWRQWWRMNLISLSADKACATKHPCIGSLDVISSMNGIDDAISFLLSASPMGNRVITKALTRR